MVDRLKETNLSLIEIIKSALVSKNLMNLYVLKINTVVYMTRFLKYIKIAKKGK